MSAQLPDITPRQIEAFRRFLLLLPDGKDRGLVVLKAHLLIEEQVRQLVFNRAENPKAVVEASLDCHQCICLAQSLYADDFQPWLWATLKKLNKIRNDIVHNIQPAGLQDRMNDFVDSFPSDFRNADELTRFEMTLWSLFTSISGLVDGRAQP